MRGHLAATVRCLERDEDLGRQSARPATALDDLTGVVHELERVEVAKCIRPARAFADVPHRRKSTSPPEAWLSKVPAWGDVQVAKRTTSALVDARGPGERAQPPQVSVLSALMDQFDGFADDDGKFFRALAKHQDRAWFQAHKAEYEEGWNKPMKLLVAELRVAIDGLYPHCDLGDPKVLRIFRDVRFSRDKSPYKTNIAAVIPTKRKGGTFGGPAALYVSIGKEKFAAAGYYMMEAADLARFRAAVAEDTRGKELAKVLAKLEKKGFTIEPHGTYARVPKGFDREHPRAEILKYKGLIAGYPPFPKGLLTGRKLVDWLVKTSKDVAPLVEWLVFATA